MAAKRRNFDSTLSISAEGLKGRRSVRATFRLPPQVIELLGIAAAQLGLKQKSLFDQLMEDADILTRVAENAPSESALTPNRERQQKTYVLSKKSLETLETVAGRQEVSRDILVEASIRRLLPVMSAEQAKLKKRELLLKDMQEYLGRGEKILHKTAKLLGRDDQVYEMMEKVVGLCREQVFIIHGMIEKGQSMEDLEHMEEAG